TTAAARILSSALVRIITATASLRCTLRHALLERCTLFRGHRRHSLFHSLAALLGSHVGIESTTASSAEAAATAACIAWVDATGTSLRGRSLLLLTRTLTIRRGVGLLSGTRPLCGSRG